MTVYMEVTRDKYELPIRVEDSMSQLARMCGVAVTSVCHSINKPRKRYRPKYVKVEIEESAGDTN